MSLVEMGRAFHKASGLPFEFDPERFDAFCDQLDRNPAGYLLVTDKGMIGGALAEAYCGDWLMAVEFFWWSKGDGMPLLRCFEEWAAERGANEVRMTTLAQLARAERLMVHKGYRAIETSWAKVI